MTSSRIIRLLVLPAILMGLALSSPARANDASDGMVNFNARRYHAAAQNFAKALEKDPGNAKLHYYLGKSFEYLKEYDSARESYNNAFKLSLFGTEGRMARQALLDLAGKEAQHNHPAPIDPPKIVAQSVAQINNQCNDARTRYTSWGEAYSRQRLRAGEDAARQYGYQAQLTRVRGYRRDYYDQEVSNWATIRSNFARNDAMAYSMRSRAAAMRQAAEMQMSATNLKRLMAEQPHAGEPHLRALGTNLYVRNYQTDDDYDAPPPEDPPLELRAVAKRLLSSADQIVQKHGRSR